jgi:hypothetical protein
MMADEQKQKADAGEETALGDQPFEEYQATKRAPASTPPEGGETKEAPKSEDAGDPEREAGAQEPEADETQTKPSGEPEGEKPKRKGGFQRKIEQLEQTIAELQAQKESPPEPKPVEEPKEETAAAESERPKPPKLPREESFDTDEAWEAAQEKYEKEHAEYTEKLTDWKLDQREKKRAAEEAKRAAEAEQKRVLEEHKQREAAFRQQHDDYDEARSALVTAGVPDVIAEAIVESPHGPAIVLHLGTNLDEYGKIKKLSPNSAVRRLGALEARFEKPSTTPAKGYTPPEPPIEKVSSGAPPPVLDGSESFEVYQAKKRQGARVS